MNVVSILFYFFLGLAGIAAGAILFSKDVFKSALYLLVSLLSIAALYVLSLAEFLAVAQILIYAGGILVVIIFGIMLTTKISGKPLVVTNRNLFGGGLVCVPLLVLLVMYLPAAIPGGKTMLGPADMRTTGLILFSEYTLPFEIAGILLLIALVGAAVITSNMKSET